MEINYLPLEIRLKIMSYNCYDICHKRYNDILKHPFPSWEKVKRNPFWSMTLKEILKGRKSKYEIYSELKTIYNYSYIFRIEYQFKNLEFIENIDDMKKDDKLLLAIEYQDTMKTLLSMMPFRTEADWHIQFYERLSPYDKDNDYESGYESDNYSVGSYE